MTANTPQSQAEPALMTARNGSGAKPQQDRSRAAQMVHSRSGGADTRQHLYAQIRPMRDDDGLKWREIGERLGISLTYAQDIYTDPSGEARAARHRRFAASHRANCDECGVLRPPGSVQGKFCAACLAARRERRAFARAGIIADLWEEGRTMQEIADLLGWTKNHCGVEIARIRQRWPELLPHRRTPEQVERIREGSRLGREKAA